MNIKQRRGNQTSRCIDVADEQVRKVPLCVSRKWSQREFPPHTASANQPTPSHEPSGTFCLPTSLLSCHHFSRCHLIGLLRCDITGGQLREESGQPVLWFSSCLRVQPGQALFQQVILETWDGGRGWCTLQLQRSPTCVKFSEYSLQSVYRCQTQDYLMTFNAQYF